MKTAGRWLLGGWLLAALVLLGIDGRLPEFIAGAAAGSLLVLGLSSLVRQQLAPSRYNRPPLPERYRVADDLDRPLVEVIAVAEREASARRQWRRMNTLADELAELRRLAIASPGSTRLIDLAVIATLLRVTTRRTRPCR